MSRYRWDIELLTVGPINACLAFPFPNDFIGCEILDDYEKNKQVRDIFEAIPYKMQNERLIYQAEKLAFGKIFPILMFSLKYAIDEQLDFLEEMQKNHYIYGLKYYPEADGIPFSQFQEKGKRFIDFLLKYDLPLIVHSSACTVSAESGISYPGDIMDLAIRFPKLRICIAHMGHFSTNVFDYLSDNSVDNLFFDTSPFLFLCMIGNLMSDEKWMKLEYKKPNDVLDSIVSKFGNHILWGSDYPFNYTCNFLNESHDKNYTKYSYKTNIDVLKHLKDCEMTMITHDNVIKFLYGF